MVDVARPERRGAPDAGRHRGGTWAVAAHLPAFAARDDVEPLIVCRRGSASWSGYSIALALRGPRPTGTKSIDAKPDLVVLTGPVGARAEQARMALEAARTSLPRSHSRIHPNEARVLDALARARGRTLMLCYAWNEWVSSSTPGVCCSRMAESVLVEHVSVVMGTVVRALLTTGQNYVPTEFDAPPRLETWADPSVSGGRLQHGSADPRTGVALPAGPGAGHRGDGVHQRAGRRGRPARCHRGRG